MPLPSVIGGFESYIAGNLGITVWDGEVPRQNVDGTDITPDAAAESWPAVHIMMEESGLNHEPTFEDAYGHMGPLTIDVWSTNRAQAQSLASAIFSLLAPEENYRAIDMGTGFQCFLLNLNHWTCIQELDKRTQQGELLYRATLVYDAGIHGSVATRGLDSFAMAAPTF